MDPESKMYAECTRENIDEQPLIKVYRLLLQMSPRLKMVVPFIFKLPMAIKNYEKIARQLAAQDWKKYDLFSNNPNESFPPIHEDQHDDLMERFKELVLPIKERKPSSTPETPALEGTGITAKNGSSQQQTAPLWPAVNNQGQITPTPGLSRGSYPMDGPSQMGESSTAYYQEPFTQNTVYETPLEWVQGAWREEIGAVNDFVVHMSNWGTEDPILSIPGGGNTLGPQNYSPPQHAYPIESR
jgi:hypothetical protein